MPEIPFIMGGGVGGEELSERAGEVRISSIHNPQAPPPPGPQALQLQSTSTTRGDPTAPCFCYGKRDWVERNSLQAYHYKEPQVNRRGQTFAVDLAFPSPLLCLPQTLRVGFGGQSGTQSTVNGDRNDLQFTVLLLT